MAMLNNLSTSTNNQTKSMIVIIIVVGVVVLAATTFLYVWDNRRNKKSRSSSEDNAPSGKQELDGNTIERQPDLRVELGLKGEAKELAAQLEVQELSPQERAQELPYFNQAPQELPADVPGYRESTTISTGRRSART
jgi:flagellar basal body-associated protein FliL